MSDRDGGDSGEQLVAERVEQSVRQKMGSLDMGSLRSFHPNIIKVPADVRKGHDDAYEPKLFFIGPYHRWKKDDPSPTEQINDPSPTEQIKLLYVQDLLSRDEEHNKLSLYTSAIVKDEKKARRQYSDRIGLSKEKFVEMLVIDGCFIIEFLLKRAEGKVGPPLSCQVRNLPTLRRDLLLLENQIPFFILNTILQKSNYNIPEFPEATLIDLVLHYLHKGKIKKHMLSKPHQQEEKIYHLLHLSYLCLLQGLSPSASCHPTTDPETLSKYLFEKFKRCISALTRFLKRSLRSIRHYASLSVIFFLCYIVHVVVLLFLWRSPSWSVSSKKTSKKPRMLPTATELKEAGVTFKKKKKNADCYLDVSFDKEGYFEIPLLSIQENTNSVFRNFLAFEQSCPNVGNSFTSYVVLMDNLIDTSSDVAVLKRRGVLESKLGCDDDVAKLFNQMRSGLCFDFDKHYLDEMFRDVKDYCNKEHNRWRAKLMHDYLGNPWAIISIVAAVALLVLTTLQAIYSVLSYKKG